MQLTNTGSDLSEIADLSMDDVSGVFLSGGTGSRMQPLSLLSDDYFLSKAMFRILGTPIIEGQMYQLAEFGIKDAVVITRHRENIHQISDRLSHAGALPFGYNSLSYTHPKDDHENTGSADAYLSMLATNIANGLPIKKYSIVLPNDNLFDLVLGFARTLRG